MIEKTLKELGYETKLSRLDEAWETEQEVHKLQWADVVIVQTPGWWMTTPWQFTQYMDYVFIQPGICGTDGRSHTDPKKNYGRGGILTDKKYMLSSTWNAPVEAFNNPGEFFEARGIDGVFFPLHKAFQFLGMTALPSFMANDVLKNPTIDKDEERLIAHIKEAFPKIG